MTSYLNFFIEANICLLILGGFYFIVLNKERSFRWKRLYILSVLLLSVSIPLIQFENPFGSPISLPVANDIQAMILPEIVISAESNVTLPSTFDLSRGKLLAYIYGSGIVIFTTLFLYQLLQIFRFYQVRKKDKSIQGNHILIPTNGQFPTFSFFNLLFFDNTVDLTVEEKDKMLQHESAHIRQWHSVDILLIEMVKIIFWLNPIIWMLRKSLQNVHEYLADESILKSNSTTQYSRLLAKMAVQQMTLSLGHHFNKSLILKRIEIMKSPRKKPVLWKWLSALPLAGLMTFAFSCNDEIAEDVSEVMETAKQVEIPTHLEAKVAELQEKYPNAEFAYFETAVDNESKLDEFKDLDPSSIAFVEVKKDPDMIGVLVNKKGALEVVAKATSQGNIFQIVDEPAMPDGGYASYYEHIKVNMNYPDQARKLGIEGKVYVQFIVDEGGAVTEVQVVKGIGAGCDAEAARVIRLPYQWSSPKQKGTPVKQRIILPITFSIAGGAITNNQKTNDWVDVQELDMGDVKTISGKVISESGKPLPGVNIVVQGSHVGTVTNIKGEYKIEAPEKSTLVYSFIGFQTTAHQVDAKSVVDMVLSE